jgi:pyrroline-5-carboxylate reductase
MLMPKLQVIGGGKMGEALLAGLLTGGWASATELRVAEKLADRAAQLRVAFPGVEVAGEPDAAHGHVVAVKPGDVDAVCRALAATGSRAPVLSIAAGVTIRRLEAGLAPGTPVVRAMPNTPALVGAGAAAVAAGRAADEADLAWAEEILGVVGMVVRVDEPLLDAVTGLSGSGPAYVFLVAEALIEGGVLAGLPRPVATALAVQTLLGSARLLDESPEGPADLRAAVTSPGGTTAAGLRALEAGGVRAAFLEAVLAATERSRELGRN